METQTITEDTLIGDIVENYPEVVETLLNYGVHCVGCHVSPFEPLGDGLRSHGMEEEEVEEAITKLNSILSSRKESGNGSLPSITLSVTDSAAKKIKSSVRRNKNKLCVLLFVPADVQAIRTFLIWQTSRALMKSSSQKKMLQSMLTEHQ